MKSLKLSDYSWETLTGNNFIIWIIIDEVYLRASSLAKSVRPSTNLATIDTVVKCFIAYKEELGVLGHLGRSRHSWKTKLFFLIYQPLKKEIEWNKYPANVSVLSQFFNCSYDRWKKIGNWKQPQRGNL